MSHSPGHLRAALCAALSYREDPWWEAFDGQEERVELFLFDAKKQALWESLDARGKARWLTGQLWHSTDCLPADTRADLEALGVELPGAITFACAARALREWVDAPDD